MAGPKLKDLVLDISTHLGALRIEMYVPIKDKDGNLIDPGKFYQLSNELTKNFGGCSFDYPYGGSGGIDGVWYSSDSKITYYDKNAIFIVWVADDARALDYFRKKKTTWVANFGQEILVITIQKMQII